MHLLTGIGIGILLAALRSPTFTAASELTTFYNPVIPGWNSDPSCALVDDTFFCVTSTFIAFPGLPVYASKDLVNWKLASHVWNRESQLPGISRASYRQMGGMYAATLREHNGTIYVICEYLNAKVDLLGVLFRTTNPYNDKAWSNPVTLSPYTIDPDLFWDDDGKVYMASQHVDLQEINPATGELSQPPALLWNGTGGVWPEGPHLYKKDGWYYLLIAEGGTALDHAVTMARSRNIWGPYEPSPHNPHLTNRGTKEYFQTVGHADLFQDREGNWWGMALATRSGPDWEHYSMGRETVLFPAKWEEGQWPVLEPVRGEMKGPLPKVSSRDLPIDGPFHSDSDDVDFTTASRIPRHFVHWRVPREESFSLHHGKGLKFHPTRANLTGVVEAGSELNGQGGIAFVGRRQVHSLFAFSVDFDFAPREVGQEVGVTVFLTQYNHIDLGVVVLNSNSSNASASSSPGSESEQDPVRVLRLRTTSFQTGEATPETLSRRVPDSWSISGSGSDTLRLEIEAVNLTHYRFSAMPAADTSKSVILGFVSSRHVSGGTGPFVGSLVGAYATCNGQGEGYECPGGASGDAYVSRWRYTPTAQYVTEGEAIPADAHPSR